MAATKNARAGSRLKRAQNPMTSLVRRALTERNLLAAYRSRPAYQQNDYLGWIARAVREATQQKRLAQMLDELARGDVYMNMRWSPTRVAAAAPEPARTRKPKAPAPRSVASKAARKTSRKVGC